MASGRASTASSYLISGSGLESSIRIGSFAITLSISVETLSATETPTKTSALRIASNWLRASVSTAYRSFQRFMPLVRPL